jgi:hypothetical protein
MWLEGWNSALIAAASESATWVKVVPESTMYKN